MKRLPTLAFGGLAVATVAAFFIIQHLKVSTPFITGVRAPSRAVIDPLGGGSCSRTSLSFSLLHRSDNVDVYVVDQSGRIVATLASGVFMPGLPNPVTRTFTWTGRETDGRKAPPGEYSMKVVLRRQDRTIDITNSKGLTDWVKVEYSPRCPTA
ncbi:MAG TPA: FlgD immunoglobulin-like domain containing protein [Solirubrobacteraceae bacterium]